LYCSAVTQTVLDEEARCCDSKLEIWGRGQCEAARHPMPDYGNVLGV